MKLTILATASFNRVVKKLHKKDKNSVDDAVNAIAVDPSLGEDKKGTWRVYLSTNLNSTGKNYYWRTHCARANTTLNS